LQIGNDTYKFDIWELILATTKGTGEQTCIPGPSQPTGGTEFVPVFHVVSVQSKSQKQNTYDCLMRNTLAMKHRIPAPFLYICLRGEEQNQPKKRAFSKEQLSEVHT